MGHKRVLRPLFIGLPGAGKTTFSALVAARLGLEVIGTDPLFRVFRAIPASEANDPRAEVMRAFLARAAKEYPAQVEQLRADASALDEKGRCALHDSVRFRAYGEDVFRLFEIEMLRFLDATGALVGKIADLSASAPLYEENRNLFAPENGYLPILVDTPAEQIAQNLLKDYLRYRAQSLAAGEKKPIRGAYEKAMDAALGQADPALPESREIILTVARDMTAKEAAKRMDKYKTFARGVSVKPEPAQTAERLVDLIVALCEGKDSLSARHACSSLL